MEMTGDAGSFVLVKILKVPALTAPANTNSVRGYTSVKLHILDANFCLEFPQHS